jgi:hypothetical protein
MLEVVLSSFPFLSCNECSSIIKERNKVGEGVQKFVVIHSLAPKAIIRGGSPKPCPEVMCKKSAMTNPKEGHGEKASVPK